MRLHIATLQLAVAMRMAPVRHLHLHRRAMPSVVCAAEQEADIFGRPRCVVASEDGEQSKLVEGGGGSEPVVKVYTVHSAVSPQILVPWAAKPQGSGDQRLWLSPQLLRKLLEIVALARAACVGQADRPAATPRRPARARPPARSSSMRRSADLAFGRASEQPDRAPARAATIGYSQTARKAARRAVSNNYPTSFKFKFSQSLGAWWMPARVSERGER